MSDSEWIVTAWGVWGWTGHFRPSSVLLNIKMALWIFNAGPSLIFMIFTISFWVRRRNASPSIICREKPCCIDELHKMWSAFAALTRNFKPLTAERNVSQHHSMIQQSSIKTGFFHTWHFVSKMPKMSYIKVFNEDMSGVYPCKTHHQYLEFVFIHCQ